MKKFFLIAALSLFPALVSAQWVAVAPLVTWPNGVSSTGSTSRSAVFLFQNMGSNAIPFPPYGTILGNSIIDGFTVANANPNGFPLCPNNQPVFNSTQCYLTFTYGPTFVLPPSLVLGKGFTMYSVVPPGAWQFNITSGDSAAQLAASGDTEFFTQLLIDGNGFLTNIQDATLTTSAAQHFGGEDGIILSGSISEAGPINVIFDITNGNGSTAQYNFLGTLSTTGSGTRTITGTYTTTGADVANCSQTYCITSYIAGGGTFSATYFPPLFQPGNNTYFGEFDAPLNLNSGAVGPGPDNIAATLTFTSQTVDGNVSGTIALPNGMNDSTSGAACFTNWPDGNALHFDASTLGPEPTGIDSGNWQTGYTQQFWATDHSPVPVHVLVYGYSMGDCNGTEVPSCPTNPLNLPDTLGETMPAAAGAYFPFTGGPQTTFDGGRWNGTNSELYLSYAITGGPCDGMGGGDQPFMKTRKVRHGIPRPKHPRHHHRDRWHRKQFGGVGNPGYGRSREHEEKEAVHPTEAGLLRVLAGND